MTKEEAIQILSTRDAHGVLCGYTSGVTEALDMAIEALSEPINCVKCKHYYETEDDTNVYGHCKMDTAHTNLMSKEEAIEMLKALNMMLRNPNGEPISDVCDALDMAIEALQFVEHFELLKEYQSLQEVVYCKDCDRGFGSPVCPIQSQGWAINKDTFYCA